jgi:hypothetical protein
MNHFFLAARQERHSVRILEVEGFGGKFVVSKVREAHDLRETERKSEIQVDIDFLFVVPTPPD